MTVHSPPFERLLIANRGEIAVRIQRACRDLGIESVAVASQADADSMHARAADRVVVIGPAPATESYLRGDKLIDVALAEGCQAVHPGYGFLSQSADFAEAVADAGLTFVGPPPEATRLMGDKTAARRTMSAAGVPVVPGYQGTGDEDLETLTSEAERVGFPLLIKAAAGGGGKGMRVVRAQAELADGLEAARHEATKAFGDGRLFLERFIEQAHHVEVQVLADTHGTVLHLFERECSLQRRYQKILEESPSPVLDDSLRQEITATAVAAARACGYVNAGTIEFLVSATDRSFFFLEMNTRLQVEHPVTELVTGIDLVAEQIRVAAGQPLRFGQADLSQRGHAVECRLYAEDAASGFAPATGTAHRVHFPTGPGIRIDAGIESGDAVTVYYDPLLAKIIVWAPDRSAALRRMGATLDGTAILGVTTNLAFLRALIDQPAVRDGSASTTFVEQTLADWLPPPAELTDEALIAVALVDRLALGGLSAGDGADGGDGDRFSPWSRPDQFRVGG